MAQLKNQVRQNENVRGRPVHFICEDANSALSKLAKQGWKSRRAILFLDPFALHIRWSTLVEVAKTGAMDVWMLFPAMAVNRMLPRSAEVPPSWAQRLDETFGDSSWRQEFYAKTEQPFHADLFSSILPEAKESKLDDPFGRLSRYVARRLKAHFAGVVEKPLILKTESGSPLFLLCFAVANKKGAAIATRIAQHIIKKQQHGN